MIENRQVVKRVLPELFESTAILPVDLDFKQALLEMKSEGERIEILTEYYRATIPKIELSLRVRQRASWASDISEIRSLPTWMRPFA